METKSLSTVGALKVAFAGCGCVGLFVASIVVAFQARHYQISGQPMPNGKGGVMTPGDGYMIAAVFLLMSVAGLLTARRFLRETRA